MDHETLAERYRSAFYRGDPESLRGLLVPDFTFAGPAATYHGIDVFVKASNHVRRIVKSVEVRTLFDAPDQTCAILTLVVENDVERFTMVEWYRFEGDQIASVETIFDTGPFLRRAGGIREGGGRSGLPHERPEGCRRGHARACRQGLPLLQRGVRHRVRPRPEAVSSVSAWPEFVSKMIDGRPQSAGGRGAAASCRR